MSRGDREDDIFLDDLDRLSHVRDENPRRSLSKDRLAGARGRIIIRKTIEFWRMARIPTATYHGDREQSFIAGKFWSSFPL